MINVQLWAVVVLCMGSIVAAPAFAAPSSADAFITSDTDRSPLGATKLFHECDNAHDLIEQLLCTII